MADTTIKVDTAVRDRLAVLAAQRGATIRDLVAELARATPTQEELDARHAVARAYLRDHLCPDLNDDDAATGERFWRDLEAGRTPPTTIGAVQDRPLRR
jgi:hypothetical protein